MIRMIDGYEGTLVVRAALKLAPLLFVRPGELANAKWEHFDLDAAEWRFEPSKRKRGQQRRELSFHCLDKLLRFFERRRPSRGRRGMCSRVRKRRESRKQSATVPSMQRCEPWESRRTRCAAMGSALWLAPFWFKIFMYLRRLSSFNLVMRLGMPMGPPITERPFCRNVAR